MHFFLFQYAQISTVTMTVTLTGRPNCLENCKTQIKRFLIVYFNIILDSIGTVSITETPTPSTATTCTPAASLVPKKAKVRNILDIIAPSKVNP